MHQSDESLFRRLAGGDEAAFGEIYERHQGRVYRFALQMCGSQSVAEEVTQEVFLAMLRSNGFDPAKGVLIGYLLGVARFQVLRWLERHRPSEPIGEWTAGQAAADPDPLDELARQSEIEEVRRAVLSLPESYREVVVLCDLQELDYATAAQTLGCPVGTVRSRLSRGRTMLAEKLRSKRSSPCLR